MYIHHKLGTWKNCNKYIVLNEHARKLFLNSNLQLTEKQLVVKPNFNSVSAMQVQKRGDHFLYVGRLSEEKGIMLLLSVFSACSYNIKIAGDGPLKQDVIQYASKYPNIEFLGSVNQSAILALMQQCTALVFPSLWFEGMPLTIIEAFACSTPIIASKLGAMETMITSGYNGLHFEVNNSTDLQKKLDDWINLDQIKKSQYQENTLLTYNNNYTSEKNIAQLLQIYNEVIGCENL
ncbi:MAG: glycosyltransferase [Sphingobacteriaceae bacterium]|nr:MAG: glycosyltransferase [Sphingobacteriaceae bacterium]